MSRNRQQRVAARAGVAQPAPAQQPTPSQQQPAAQQQAVAASVPATPPPQRHVYDIPDEVRAQIETFSPEEQAQRDADAQRERTQLGQLDARISGGADFNEDKHDPLDFFEAQPAHNGFQTPPPAGIAAEPPAQSAPTFHRVTQDVQEAVPVREFTQPAPERLWDGQRRGPGFDRRDRQPDRPMPMDNEENPIAAAFGARTWNASYSFDWCRDPMTGVRHEFTFYFPEVGALVDVYDRDGNDVRAEVAAKADAIRRRNEVAQNSIGYIGVVRGYVAREAEIADVRAGYVCDDLRLPPAAPRPVPDVRDTVRAASGDPFAAAAYAGADPGLGGWNKAPNR